MAAALHSLYAIEDNLMALLECLETVAPEQEQEYILDLAKALGQAKDKRDMCAQYMAHCENQIEFARAEIKRLQERKAEFEANLEKLKRYVVQIMDAIGTRKLEGNSVTFSLRKCPPSVEVTDEAAIPPQYKTATLQMPGHLADELLDLLPLDAPVSLNMTCDKRAIKDALAGGLDVAGASFAPERSTVTRK
jgi:hypothetical protein